VTESPLIAVIDDDESLRNALVGLVRSVGYEARGFAAAEDFLRADPLQTFDCIISDIQMPGMSGIDLKRHLTTHGIDAPMIMITARSEPELAADARGSGALCLLHKPFEGDALIRWVEKALELAPGRGRA